MTLHTNTHKSPHSPPKRRLTTKERMKKKFIQVEVHDDM